MKHLKISCLGLLLLCTAILALHAEEILFIGNSFTFGGEVKEVVDFGGVPKLVEAIAQSKGKTANTKMVTTGGKDWAFHLANPDTDIALKSKSWDWVVLQDYSTKATHVGNVEAFMKNGADFYTRIGQESPKANIVLYETWALGSKNPIYADSPSSKTFSKPAEMIGEIEKNYTALAKSLQARDAHKQVRLALVGTAFARCLKEHPEINLYASDFKHASCAGSYLSALVIYATIFHDSPKGATAKLPGFTLDAKDASNLQAVAAEVTAR